MIRSNIIWTIALLLCVPVCVPAAPPISTAHGVATIVAANATGATAIRLDGSLTEDVWRTAQPVSDFVQRDPNEGAAPSMNTEARVVYDAANLYIAVRAFDPEPSRIVGHLTRRDAMSPSDWIRVIVDSYHDRRTAYEFAVNPAGVKQDKYWFSDTNTDESWDAVWDVMVSRDQEGWKAEFRIPFSQLRFNPASGATFGFAVTRTIARLNETNTWPLLSKKATGYVSSFGELSGLHMTAAAKRLELLPYTLGGVSTQPNASGNPLVKSTAPSAAVGLDVKYAVTPGLTLTATINPDFGQVEADPAVVNLGAFETFFSERRPFFVEGSGNFRFDMDCNDGNCTGMFYSRRIGRQPQGNGALPGGDGTFTAPPSQTTILGATKLTGRKGAYSMGIMNAVTKQESATIAFGSGRSRQVVEPLTNYSVARVRREFKNQSSLGFMTTTTNRQLITETMFLPGKAYSGGIDWDWRLGKRYSLTGYWAGSTIQGTSDAILRLQQNSRHYFQRPDSTSLTLDASATSLNGNGGSLAISKIGGEYVRFNSNVQFKSPGFDTNDIGFMRRTDQRTVGNWIQIRREKPNKWFRSRRINFNQYMAFNYDGQRIFSGGNINAHAQFVNNYGIGGGFNVNQDQFDDRLTRGGPGGVMEGYRTFWSYVEGDTRKPVSVSGFFGHGWTKHGASFADVHPGVTIRPMSSLSFNVNLGYSRNTATQQWITKEASADGAPHYVFGHLDQTTVSINTRVNYTLTPTLSIQVYAAPFVSAGDYGQFQELANGHATRYEDRWAPYAYGGNPDFNYKSFRTTNVLRWEYKPGSTLFVVWQQGREDSTPHGDFRFGRDFGDVFGIPSTNRFLVKLSYWLNY